MKSLKIFIIAILVVAGVAITPLVVKKSVNETIEKERASLSQKGLKLDITKEDGYFSSVREFDIKVEDSKLFKDFILDELSKVESINTNLFEAMKAKANSGYKEVLEGMLFKGQMKNSNLFPQDSFLEFHLASLSDVIMTELKRKKDIYKIINPIFEEKILAFTLTLDSNQKLKSIFMKNIDKVIDNGSSSMGLVLEDNKLVFVDKEYISGSYSLKKCKTEIKSKYSNSDNEINNINYQFDYKDRFNNDVNLVRASFCNATSYVDAKCDFLLNLIFFLKFFTFVSDCGYSMYSHLNDHFNDVCPLWLIQRKGNRHLDLSPIFT